MEYQQTQIQKTVDLPASSATPVEIPCAGFSVVWASVGGAFQMTFAENATDGLTRIASKNTRETILSSAGFERPVNGTDNLYIRSNGVAVTDGLSYGLGIK